jgi:PIN domain nuclease of toxin-antitoxin system
MVVLDTSVLIRWTLEPDALSLPAARAIKEGGQIIVSSMSIWEIGWKMKLSKLALPLSAREYAIHLGQVQNVEIVPVDTENWLRNVELVWDRRDPVDRTIIATADLRGCPLVTSDRRMQKFYARAIW